MHYAELYCIVQYLGPVEFGNNLKETIYSNRHQDKGFEYSPDTIFMFLSGRSIQLPPLMTCPYPHRWALPPTLIKESSLFKCWLLQDT